MMLQLCATMLNVTCVASLKMNEMLIKEIDMTGIKKITQVKHKLCYPVPVADITASFDIADNNFLETLDGY